MAEMKHFIFFDFEMLCSNRGMPYEEMEAIRLGAVKYNIETEKVTYFDRFIQPSSLNPLTKFCKKLTGIEDSDLLHAERFDHVFADFLSWVGGVKKARFFSWSKSDLTRLKFDAKLNNISNNTIDKIEKRYVDFQAILSKRVSKDNMSVQNALDLYDLHFIGSQHNPMYDAFNTLRIYLCFSNQPLKSDLIMLNQFVFEKELNNRSNINRLLQKQLKQDLVFLLNELQEMYKLRQAHKVIKRVKRLVKKYENILINRSGIFSNENIQTVRLIKSFYEELLNSYHEHHAHASKVMILDDHLVKPIKQIAI
ncbi:exonuclease domain-containing protein [Aquibacillus koreensis]|uniref:Exonuclease domain-containing protein n=1 Tax=Aquibacillus koreensis TaxID=279446 RepID=A0A9X4AKE4_9BACI|nr:3'-5' exonuclease [Aquibacillus koreensis]MCT2536336.1 exonuclease domain-containing protein [Aquibacillus koreensis]MDC3421313.1 exonuclease domain-containing protein [Aquibacillus koreensis]